MNLALKIAAAVTIVIAVILGVDGGMRVQRQLTTFEADTRRDHLSMGHATAAVISESWASYGEPLAMDLIDKISKKTQKVSVRWVPLSALCSQRAVPALDHERCTQMLAGSALSRILPGVGGYNTMVTYIPVSPRGELKGAVEISESLARQSRHVRVTVLRTLVTTIVAILICGAATLLLGVYLIGRPIRLLVQQAESIGKGDFDRRIRLTRRDEIAELSRTMNTMAEKLAAAIQQIESETQARLETLEQLRHADRLKTVGQLTSGVVHEIGTPLTVIAGRAKMIQSAEVEGEEARNCARIVVEQAGRVTQVVRQILDFARKTDAEKFIQNIFEVVEQMVSLLNPVAVKTGIYLELERRDHGAFAEVDAGQIQQVLANLIINAIQASHSGGRVTVAVHKETASPPDGPPRAPAEFWVIQVRDEGCGISEETMPRIFESFYTTKASGNGTGLGLAISKEMVREHGGWISVDSEVNKGSTFRVYLPFEKGPR